MRNINVIKHKRVTKNGLVVPVISHNRSLPKVKAQILKKSRSKRTDIGKLQAKANFFAGKITDPSFAKLPSALVLFDDLQLLDEIKPNMKDKFATRLAQLSVKRDKLKKDIKSGNIDLDSAERKQRELSKEDDDIRADMLMILIDKEKKEQILKELK